MLESIVTMCSIHLKQSRFNNYHNGEGYVMIGNTLVSYLQFLYLNAKPFTRLIFSISHMYLGGGWEVDSKVVVKNIHYKNVC